jgi:hypothetical protein
MALPEQIRKQSEAVQELYKQMTDEPEGIKPEGTSPADENPAPVADAGAGEPVQPQAVEQPPADEKPPEETVLQKYKTLQGMYNAEVPRLHQQNREKEQRLQQLEQLLASMQSTQAQAKPTQQAPEKLVSEKDVEEYGESLDVMRKVSREEISPVLQRLTAIEGYLQQMQTSVVPQVQQVAHRQAVSAEQAFWAGLTDAVSNWREINDQPDFQSWLLEADPLTGITRQTYLEDAQRALDAGRVANFFRAWLERTGQATVAQSTGRASASSELERQVAPGRSKSGGSPTKSKGQMYTPEDIQKFFNEVRQGKYKGREADRDRIERDIFAAQRENRIQLNA